MRQSPPPRAPFSITRPPHFYAPIVDLGDLLRDSARAEDQRLALETPPPEVYFVRYPVGYPREWRI